MLPDYDFGKSKKSKSGRDKKVAEEIRREASQILSIEIADPQILGTTVTGVRMSPDLKLARIYFALPGREDEKEKIKKALDKSVGFIRKVLSERIRIKFMPQIEFFYDESLEIQTKINEIFQNLPSSTGEED